MSKCCDNAVGIGCVGHCGITTPFNAELTGQHTVEFSFLGHLFYFLVDAEVGQPFEFPNGVFNERSCVTFNIIDPNGNDFDQTAAELSALGIETSLTGPFTCFKMDIRPRRELNTEPITSAAQVTCLKKLTPAKQLFESVVGDSVTITDFAVADVVSWEVYVDGRLVDEDETPSLDVIGWTRADTVITFSEDITGSTVLVKVLLEEDYPCV